MHSLRFVKLLILLPVFYQTVLAQQSSLPTVVVYGGTAGGVMAAIAAAREGASVQLVEPGRHIGGMVTGGLSHTDYGDRAVIGGLALDFYRRVAKHYNKDLYFWRGPEPTVGETILKNWLADSKVTVLYGERVQSVAKVKQQIKSIRLTSGKQLTADVFIDATYEGDLLARAGVSYAIGREGIRQYNETWAGRQPIYPDAHNFPLPVSPFKNEKDGEVLPLVNKRPLVAVGEADSAVQAYCFRLIMTNNPANRVPITRPARYDSARYELLRRWLRVRKPTTLRESGILRPTINLPNQKAEINSGGPISTNLYDASNWPYPDANYAQRDKIWQDHLDYTHGLLYFAANDPSVPQNIRYEAREWGLCRDEFADTDHFPHQLYVRVARRMIGEYVLTQHDLDKHVTKYDAIGMGSYNIDVRHVQRNFQWVSHFPELNAETVNEGYISIPVLPYEIPYRALVPKYEECTNLIVPVCISSSNLAYASFRMEPQYMIAGHSAGVAAAMAGRQNIAVQRLDIVALQKKLLEQGQILSFSENPNGFFGQNTTVIVDDDMTRFVQKRGAWQSSENPLVARKDITYLLTTSPEPAQVTYTPYLPATGRYKVYGWWPMDKTAATNTLVKIDCADGPQTVSANQRTMGNGWVLLGTYRFEAGQKSRITVSNEGADGTVIADAFKLELVK